MYCKCDISSKMHRLISIPLSLLAFQLSVAAADYLPSSETWPEPRQTGWDRNCQQWTMAEQGDTCWQLAADLHMDLQDFLDMNPQLSNDCVHNLWAGYWYCTATTVPPGLGPAVTTPHSTDSSFSTKSTDAASFSVISYKPITTPLAPGPDFPWAGSPPGFTTKSTDAASFSAIAKRGTGLPHSHTTQ